MINSFYSATVDYYKARRPEALETLELYTDNANSIGEHSNLLEEIRKWTEVLYNANSVLETSGRDFAITGDQIQIQNFDHQIARSI